MDDDGGKWLEALVKETSSLASGSALPSRHDDNNNNYPDLSENVAAGRPSKRLACHRDLGVFVVSEGSDGNQQLFVFHPSGKTEIRLEGTFLPRKVERLLINRGATALCLLGLTECVIVNISYRAKQAIKRAYDEPSITCAATTIAHDNEGIVHAAWHPASDRHLAVLTTDMVWRLYNKENPAGEEQTFRLRPRSDFVNLISFSFGYGAIGWASFAVFFLSDEGDVYFLCPVVPHGCVVSAETIGEARSDLESRVTDGSFETFEAQNIQRQLARKWLEETFGIDEQSVRSRRKARSLICAEAAQSFVRRQTTLQGPLREDAHHQDSLQSSPDEVSSLVCLPTEPLVLLRGWSSGFVDVLFFVGEIAPHWATPEIDSDRDFPFEDALRMFERLNLVLQEQAIRAPLEIHPDPLQPEYVYITHGAGVHCAILHWLPSLRSASLSESLPSTALYVLFADPLHTGRVLPFRGCDFLEGLTLSGRYFLGLGWNGELVSLDITRKWPSLVDDALTPSSHEAPATTSLSTLAEELREARSDRQLAPLPEVPRGSSLDLDLFRNFAEQLDDRKETLEIIYTLVERRVQLLHKIEDETTAVLVELREEIGKAESKSKILQQKLEKVEARSKEINERIRTQTEKLNNLDDTRSDAEREHEQFLRRAKMRQLKNLTEEVHWLKREGGSSTAPSTLSARAAGNRGAVLSPFEKQLAGSLKRTLEKLHKEKINAMKERVMELDNELASLSL